MSVKLSVPNNSIILALLFALVVILIMCLLEPFKRGVFMSDIMKEKMIFLIRNGIPKESVANLTAGAMWFQEMGGIPLNEYWVREKFDNRDEFFLLANTLFSLTHLASTSKHKNEWRLTFDGAFLFQAKANAQSVVAIEKTVSANCYADAYAVCRAMHSRLNLLLLFSLNPFLFDYWLKNPKDERFLDGRIRSELENNGICTMPHLYKLYSEIIHGQYPALAETGYMEQGVFIEIPAIKNTIYVAAKFILAMASYSMLSMAIADLDSASFLAPVQEWEILFDFLTKDILAHNRFDHLWTVLAESRHWEKMGKNRYKVGSSFDYKGYRDQLIKFHRASGQRKRLSKQYDIS